MPTVRPTVDELVAYLKKSRLPTILVEGDDDIPIYRFIEAKLGAQRANIMPCGCRPELLQIYERRSEFSQQNTVFVADRDMWFFTAVPQGYSDVVFTSGYSIENDLYAGSNIEGLLEPNELADLHVLLDEICTWFAFEVEEFRAGRAAHVAFNAQQLIPLGQTKVDPNILAQRGFLQPHQVTIAEVRHGYQLGIRGKLLIGLLLRFLNAPGRWAKHNKSGLLESALKLAPSNIHIDALTSAINARL